MFLNLTDRCHSSLFCNVYHLAGESNSGYYCIVNGDFSVVQLFQSHFCQSVPEQDAVLLIFPLSLFECLTIT